MTIETWLNAKPQGGRRTGRESHLDWRRASASQLTRILVDAESVSNTALKVAGDEVVQCEVRQVFDVAPHLPIAGTSVVSVFNEKVQVVPDCSDDFIALRANGHCSEYPLLARISSKRPPEVWDRGLQPLESLVEYKWMSAGGLKTDVRAERTTSLHLQCKGARPWMIERRNGMAREFVLTDPRQIIASPITRF